MNRPLVRSYSAQRRRWAWPLVCLMVLSTQVPAQDRAIPHSRVQIQLSYAPVLERVTPAVVNIYAKRLVRQRSMFNDPFFRDFFGQSIAPYRQRVENSLGSGVIIDERGTIVTNNHVVEDSEEILVVLGDQREFPARIIQRDARTDLAVLAIDPKGVRLPYLALGNSDALLIGDIVLAIGNPFGVGQTVTSGIVSALARNTVGISDYRFFIQTDAAINPGNSGGALVNLAGELIGIPTAIYSRTGASNGIGFATPSAIVGSVLEAARNGGKIVRPWLGASGQPVTFDIAQSLGMEKPGGVLLNHVTGAGPAYRAGLREGDVILSINGREVLDPQAMKFRLATLAVGTQAEVVFRRDGKIYKARLSLEAPPDVPPRQETLLKGNHPLSGLVVSVINPAVREERQLPESAEGLIVTDIASGSFAGRVGIRPGDILLTVNDQKISSLRALESLLKAAQPGWMIDFQRGEQVIHLRVR